MLEGTGIYFWLLFLWYLVIYITVKISLSSLFKRMHEQGWKAYVPVYCRYVLTENLNIKKSIFFMTLIPFVNLYYYNIIIKEMLKAFELDQNESIIYILLPMYKFPQLAFKKPKYKAHEYDLTQGFLETEQMIFTPVSDGSVVSEENAINQTTVDNTNDMISIDQNVNNVPEIDNFTQEQTPQETVFTNENLEQDEHHLTYVEAEKEKDWYYQRFLG